MADTQTFEPLGGGFTETGFDTGPATIAGSAEPVDGLTECFCPRPTIPDQLLVEAAVERITHRRTSLDRSRQAGRSSANVRRIGLSGKRVETAFCTTLARAWGGPEPIALDRERPHSCRRT